MNKKTYYNVLDPHAEESNYVVLYPFNIIDGIELFGRTITAAQSHILMQVHAELLSYLGQLYPYVIKEYCSSFYQLVRDSARFTAEDIVIAILVYAGYRPEDTVYNVNEPHFDIPRMRICPDVTSYL